MNKKGFTLIELIVVIAILGILAAIAIPRFAGIRANANLSAVETNLKNIQTAVEVFASDNNVELEDVQANALNDASDPGKITVSGDSSVTGNLIDIMGNKPEGPSNTKYYVENGVAKAEVASDIPWPKDRSRNVLYSNGIQDDESAESPEE